MPKLTRVRAVAVCAAVLSLAACTQKPATDAAGTTTTARKRIAVIPKGTTHEFWKAVHAGAVKAAREENVEVIWKGPVKEDDRDEQIKVVENFLSQGVDGIVLAPLDDRALVPVVSDAKARNIPVAIIDSGIQSEDYVSFVATDNEKAGGLGRRAARVAPRRQRRRARAALRRRVGQHDGARIRVSEDAGGEISPHQGRLVQPVRRCHHRVRHGGRGEPAVDLQDGAGHLLPERVHHVRHAARARRREAQRQGQVRRIRCDDQADRRDDRRHDRRARRPESASAWESSA